MAIESVYGFVNDDLQIELLEKLCPPSGIQTGPFGSLLHKKDYQPFGTPIITVEHLGENRIIHYDLPRVSDADKERLSRYVMQKGDIIFSRVGSVDRRALVRDEENGWLFSGRCLRVRPDPSKINPEYLSWFFGLEAFKDYIRRIAVGATMPSLNTELLSKVPIFFPPLPEQRAIAEVLGSLDDKIALNRRMNQTLEALAQAIFKSWFIDFEPVRAKMEGSTPAGMDAETAALFPDSMDGDVPSGWRKESLDQIAHFLNGLALQKYPPIGDKFLPVIKIAQLRTENTDGADKASASILKEYIIDNGDILFSWSGSLDVVIWCGGKGALNQHLFKVTSEKYPKWFYYYWILHHLQGFQAIAAGKATTMGHIQRHHLSEAKVIVPDTGLLREMDKAIAPLLEKIILNKLESNTLANLRDTLLPKLLSGEVTVDNINPQNGS